MGHRGAAAHAPENTLAGFRAAAALGCRAVELDAKLTGDGQVIVFHDDTLRRTCRVDGLVRERSLREIQALDAGAHFGAAWAGERVPTLEQALAVIAAAGMGVDVEIKPCPGRERETAAAAAAVLEACWPSAAPPAVLTSFSVEALDEARARAPQVPRGLLTGALPSGWAAIARDLECPAVIVRQARSGFGWVGRVRAGGFVPACYTVNSVWLARRLLARGVASVISDRPDRIAAACG